MLLVFTYVAKVTELFPSSGKIIIDSNFLMTNKGRLIIMIRIIQTVAVVYLMATASMVHSDEEPGLYQLKTLSLELASQAAWAAIKDCREKGYSVAVAVVDRGGIPQAQLRDHLAGSHTTETAFRKAWTASSFRQSTGDLAGMLEEKNIPNQIPSIPGALLVGGGKLIQAGGQLIGAIGVSGAPPGKSERDSIDGACAKAGIEAISETLEFAD